MMKINAATKIATLLKHDERALKAIISLSPKFEKLRNPLLRKLLAGRTSIAMASKIGGCEVADFFEQLKPLGFQVEGTAVEEASRRTAMPDFLKHGKEGEIEVLDVRPVLDAGKDPLKQILAALQNLSAGQVLKIINSFEPSPLIMLAEKKGYSSYVETVGADLVATYLYKEKETGQLVENLGNEEWEEAYVRFKDRLIEIDVRDLPMPQPMMTILEALEDLRSGQTLFVQHKKVPVFLLPELKERGFGYRIKEITDHHVQLLIFKNEQKN